jgi:hypothetical protein
MDRLLKSRKVGRKQMLFATEADKKASGEVVEARRDV